MSLKTGKKDIPYTSLKTKSRDKVGVSKPVRNTSHICTYLKTKSRDKVGVPKPIYTNTKIGNEHISLQFGTYFVPAIMSFVIKLGLRTDGRDKV